MRKEKGVAAAAVHIMAAPEPGGALLAVADGCGGIPETDLGCVFDTAWRGTRDRGSGPDSGAGLGLAIVRSIVEAYQGQVCVVNTTEGCRFEVRLPTLTGSVRSAAAAGGVGVEAGVHCGSAWTPEASAAGGAGPR